MLGRCLQGWRGYRPLIYKATDFAVRPLSYCSTASGDCRLLHGVNAEKRSQYHNGLHWLPDTYDAEVLNRADYVLETIQIHLSKKTGHN